MREKFCFCFHLRFSPLLSTLPFYSQTYFFSPNFHLTARTMLLLLMKPHQCSASHLFLRLTFTPFLHASFLQILPFFSP